MALIPFESPAARKARERAAEILALKQEREDTSAPGPVPFAPMAPDMTAGRQWFREAESRVVPFGGGVTAQPSAVPPERQFSEEQEQALAQQRGGGYTPWVRPPNMTFEIAKEVTKGARATRLPGTDVYPFGGNKEMAEEVAEAGSAEAFRLQPVWQQVAQALPPTAAMGGIWMGPSASAAGVRAGQLARKAAPVVKQAAAGQRGSIPVGFFGKKITPADVQPPKALTTISDYEDEIKRLESLMPKADSDAARANLEDWISGTKELRDDVFRTAIGDAGLAKYKQALNEQAGYEFEIAASREDIGGAGLAPKFGSKEREVYREGRKIYEPSGMWTGRSIHPLNKKEAVSKAYNNLNRATDTVNYYIKQANDALAAEAKAAEPTQVGTVQAGMGIGERPAQGGLFENLQPEGGRVPLASQESLAAAEARRRAVAAGQKPLAEAAKEAWQMTAKEFVAPLKHDTYGGSRKALANLHFNKVRQALAEGKPVPAEVLRDYPDLVAAAKPQAAAGKIRTQAATITDRRAQWTRWAEEDREEAIALEHSLRAQTEARLKAEGKPYGVLNSDNAPEWYAVYRYVDDKDAELSFLDRATDEGFLQWEAGKLKQAPAAKPQAAAAANEAELLAELKRLERREDLHSAQYGRTVPPWGQPSPNYGAPVPETSAAGKSWIRLRATQERSGQIVKELATLRAAKPQAAGTLTRGVATEPAGVAKPLSVAPTPAQAPAPPTRAATPPQPAAPPQAATGGGAAQPPQKPPTSVTPPEPLPTGKPGKSLEQADEAIARFSKFLTSPETENAWDMTVQLRKEALGQRIARFQARADELVVQGKSTEEAVTQATRETMSGTLPSTTTDLTTELRDALFAKVYHTLQAEPFEMISTSEALTNALLGKPIPRIPGTAGGSAYTRLLRVFGDTPDVVERLTRGKKIEDLVEEAALASAKKPLHTDAELEAALARIRQLPTIPHGQARLGEGPFVFRGLAPRGTPLERAESLIDTVKATYPDIRTLPEADRDVLLQTLRSTGVSDADLGRLELDLWPGTPVRPVPVYEAPIEAAVKRPSLMPLEAEHQIIAALKEVGMTAADIGNFLRANKASVDFSFWRQQAPLILNHKLDFATANVQAWKALWSEKAAAESWKRITQDPLFGLYDELGLDFLRPYEMPGKATRYRGVEEFGYLTADRPISAFTAKLPHVKVSQRAFVTGTNEHNWRIFKSFYADMLKVNEGVASGLVKMKPGQAFSIKNNLRDYGKMLQDFSGRASLGKARELGPTLGGLIFAPRYALGRLISPRHLFSGNKYVRAAAWKNAATFVGGFGSIIALGEQMNLWDVEWDPRSSDFAKIRIGNTRIDPWGGYQQFARFFAQATTNTGISGVTGAPYKLDPLQALTRFMRGKAAPLASLVADLKTGKTYVGDNVNLLSPKQWIDRVIPLLPMDIYEAVKDAGPMRGAIVAGPGAVGAGVSTYGSVAQTTNRSFNEAFPSFEKMGVYLGQVPPTLDMQVGEKGGEVELTPQQRDLYQQMTADIVIGGLQADVAMLEGSNYADSYKKEVLEKRMAELKAIARDQFKEQLIYELAQQPTGQAAPTAPSATPTPSQPARGQRYRIPVGGGVQGATATPVGTPSPAAPRGQRYRIPVGAR